MEHIQPKVMCKCIHLLVVTSVTHSGRTKYARKAIRTPGYKIEEFTCALPAFTERRCMTSSKKEERMAGKILHKHCFQFLLGHTVVPREI